MSPTTRQTMAQMLTGRWRSAKDLAAELLLTPAEVEQHLVHLARSHKQKLRQRPAACRACGFQFTSRRRLDAPGRCPRCKAQRVAGPWFNLEP